MDWGILRILETGKGHEALESAASVRAHQSENIAQTEDITVGYHDLGLFLTQLSTFGVVHCAKDRHDVVVRVMIGEAAQMLSEHLEMHRRHPRRALLSP